MLIFGEVEHFQQAFRDDLSGFTFMLPPNQNTSHIHNDNNK